MTRKKDPVWQYVYETYAEKGFKVIPVNYDDSNIQSPHKFEFLKEEHEATTDLKTIRNFATGFPYWAIQIGSYCNVLTIRFTDIDEHNNFISRRGNFTPTIVIESPVHLDYLFKYLPTDLTLLPDLRYDAFDVLYRDQFIVVPPSQSYKFRKGSLKDFGQIPSRPDWLLLGAL